MALIIKTSGERTHVTPENGEYFSLKELQKVVGGYIELVNIKAVFTDDVMVVNEEGNLMELAPNEEASIYAQQPIVGDVLICKRKEIM